MSPWYYVVQVAAIIVYGVSILVMAVVAIGFLWTARDLVKYLASISESLEQMRKPMVVMPEAAANVQKVTSEMKDLQNGEINILRHVEKAIRDLIGTIDEFQGMLVKPKERPQRVQATNESDEITAERRRQEREGVVDLERLKETGKHVGEV